MNEGALQLRQWITRSRLRQYEAAERLGLHEAHLSQILNMQRTPGLAVAVKIWRATGISVESWTETQLGDSGAAVATGPGKKTIGKA